MDELAVVAILPGLALAVGALTILSVGIFFPQLRRLVCTVFVCGAAWILSWPSVYFGSQLAFYDLLYVDGYNFVWNSIILIGLVITLLLSDEQFEKQRVRDSVDIDVLLLLAACGGVFMVASANLIVFFVAFELLSISVYVLTGLARDEQESSEAALKYFLMGAFSSAFLLYGICLIYGATGTVLLPEIARTSSQPSLMFIAGMGLVIFGFAFKVSLVPFHFWTPDAYQGAPTSMAGFMAAVVKAAAFGAFARLMFVAFGNFSEQWLGLIWVLAALTMTLGNLIALRQQSVKRMLAYSSIAHAGYALLGFFALDGGQGLSAVAFYILVYSLMTLGAFGVVLLASGGSDRQYGRDDISSFAGLGWSRPGLAFLMLIFLLSLGGIPPLAGFIGKFYLFKEAVNAGYTGLVIIAALNSVVSLFYYLRVVVAMYFTEGDEAELPLSNPGTVIALVVAAASVVYLGIFSQTTMQFFQSAVAAV